MTFVVYHWTSIFPSSEVSYWFLFQPRSSRCGFRPQGVWGSRLTNQWHYAGHGDWLRPGHMTLASPVRVNLETSMGERGWGSLSLDLAWAEMGTVLLQPSCLGSSRVPRVYDMEQKIKSWEVRAERQGGSRPWGCSLSLIPAGSEQNLWPESTHLSH